MLLVALLSFVCGREAAAPRAFAFVLALVCQAVCAQLLDGGPKDRCMLGVLLACQQLSCLLYAKQ